MDSGPEEGARCVWSRVELDPIGWSYGNQPLNNVGSRTTNFLVDWISQAPDRLDEFPPYIQLADSLEELGWVEKSNEIRLKEREHSLLKQGGLVGTWLWILDKTTGFGYEPHKAACWFIVLIAIGTVVVLLASCDKRSYSRTLVVIGWLVVAILTMASLWVACSKSATWDVKGSLVMATVLVWFCWLSFRSNRLRLQIIHTQENARSETTGNC